jgi:type IV pilus assembly protein PilB
MVMRGIHIGKLLVEYGSISEEQLQEGLRELEESSEEKRIGEVFTELGYLTEQDIMEILGKYTGLQVVDLEYCQIDERAVEKIPRQLAEKYGVLAISIEGSSLLVATSDPLDLYALEDIKLVTDMRIQLVLSQHKSIALATQLNYSGIDARAAARSASEHAEYGKHRLEELINTSEEEGAPIVRLLNSLLIKGYNTNVSDIHIEPNEQETVIRMRRDGMLLPYMTLSSSIHQGLVARIKILAHMDIAKKRSAQDGHFKIRLENKEMNIRVSFVPTIYGEKGVLRFMTTNTPVDFGNTFGMTEENYKRMMELIKSPSGIIYLTGPTGSGKTTTLYMLLQYLSSQPVNIVTLEDPVERNLPGISQIQINERAGVTFESGFRSILRQDPDIIMVGETRDTETARLSSRAAITGHLVFSTLHTNDAVSSITRLKDMGIELYLAAAAVKGVVAQRLMKKVCPFCTETYEAGENEYKILYKRAKQPGEKLMLKRGKGCYLCSDTGYKGRIAIHEILGIDPGLSKMIAEAAPIEEMKNYAVKHMGMSTLAEEAAKMVLAGITTVEEMERITYEIGGNRNGDSLDVH